MWWAYRLSLFYCLYLKPTTGWISDHQRRNRNDFMAIYSIHPFIHSSIHPSIYPRHARCDTHTGFSLLGLSGFRYFGSCFLGRIIVGPGTQKRWDRSLSFLLAFSLPFLTADYEQGAGEGRERMRTLIPAWAVETWLGPLSG